jgi:hypothetical protein
MYFRGQGTATDYAEALRWIQKAADQNDPKAEAALGYIYYDGKGVPQNYSEAARWYRAAAEQRNSIAQQGLAYMYCNGLGVSQDDTEAARLYRKAAEQGDPVAQQGLGYMYATGRGVPLDRCEAIVWYIKAAAKGDVRAKSALEALGWDYEFLGALVLFSIGLLFSLHFVLPGRTLRNRQQAATTALGVAFLASAGLNLYVKRLEQAHLGQEFRERLPIVSFPSRSQDFRLALGKTRMVKYNLGPGALFRELELRN